MKKPLALNFRDIDPKKTLVLVVDLQNDFCHEKSVLNSKNSRNRKYALAVYDFIEKAGKFGVNAAFSQQIFDKSKLTKQQKKYYSELVSGKRESFGAYAGKIKIPCARGSFGAEYFTYNPDKDRLFMKNNFDIWQNKKFVKFLEDNKIETLIITGVEIVCCVLYAIMGAEERGFRSVIPRDLVSGADDGIKEQNELLSVIGKFYGPVVSSEKILNAWDKNYQKLLK